MANEYLRRTPTSTGNRRVFTWSAWIKRNKLGGGSDTAIFASTSGATGVFRIRFTGTDTIDFIYYDGTNYGYSGTQVLRDVGGWMHILMSVDSTDEIGDNRMMLFFNGVHYIGSKMGTQVPINTNFPTNSSITHFIGCDNGPTGYWNGELADVFFIDGQALTPDVFGFYKQGKGYISAGSTQATDFRPGQWVPKSPRVIKTEINRRGGFGVNGYYLPMNDSNNFGADFHGEPNSIITLNEKLPQPRVGVASTAAVGLGYTDVLRADPYAANLVLALPCISGGTSSGFGDYSANIRGTGSNKTVTLQGGISIASTASYYGSAGNFDGSNDRLDFSSDADFALPGDFTMEMWVNWKSVGNGQLLSAGDGNNTNAFYWQYYSGQFQFGTQGVASDNVVTFTPVANQWYHVAAERKGTVLTQYVNGVAVGVTTNLTKSYIQGPLYVGWGGAGYINAYIQDVRFYKGVAKYKGGFDVPRPYTPVGIATWRQVPDTTANNFATLNPLSNGNVANSGGVQISYANGNNTATWSAGNNNATFGTVGINTGRWYWEGRLSTVGGSFPFIGISSQSGINNCVANANNAIAAGNNGVWLGNGGLSAGDIVGVAVSFTSAGVGSTITFFINNTAVTNTNFIGNRSLFDGQTNTWIPSVSGVNGSVWDFNFGQNPTFSGNTTAGTFTDSNGKGLFKFQPPSGFLALCEDNLPTPAISDPGKHFRTVLYTGDGASGRSIVGVGFTPDLVWIKGRNNATYDQKVWDSVRGPLIQLEPSSTQQEVAVSNSVVSFDSDGFDVGSYGAVNLSGSSQVAWCWRAGAGTTSTNTNGSITSVVSVNQDAGFSIVSFTGTGAQATFGHGLGKIPKFILMKRRTGGTNNWSVYHSSLGLSHTTYPNWLYLNATSSEQSSVSSANHPLYQRPDSSLIYLNTGTSESTNVSGSTYIAYCWAEIEGFSKFGSWVSNANADGPFIYCGFKPALVICKTASGDVSNWVIADSSRSPVNDGATFSLRANTADTEATTGANFVIDFLSNGFKLRQSGALNSTGLTNIFAAWAESPFQTANSK